MRILKPFLVAMCFLLLLVGCSNNPTSNNMVPVIDRDQVFDRNQDRVSNLKSWQFDGRFSLRTQQGVEHANLSWLQETNSFLIKISGPLQQGAVFIRGNSTGISYKDSKGVTDHAATAEELLTKHTPYDLPISNLRYWMLGRYAPNAPYNLTMTATGDLHTLTQQDWTIYYESFQTVENYRLPTKMILKHPQVEITVSIHDWNPNLAAE